MTDIRHVPHLNLANAFTFLRVVLVPVFAWLLVVREPSAPGVAAVVFAVAAATDGLDGWVARRLHLVSGFGQFLDPLADKLLIGVALVALASDHRMPWLALAAILAREVAVSIWRVLLARRGRSLPASRLGKLKTGSQILAVILLTALDPGSLVALIALYVAVALTWLSAYGYLTDAGAVEDWR
ncbi:MAG TPA: CDP-diacylglycerol--glycerol-3-phosphate 3-phosphatidyltransferase [Actinomycetota bacterium]|nr:CDP-diacylglycerol--glycerol-3-phosphate 3-phosphatidyltransferase [Actinomycetota bacterium]